MSLRNKKVSWVFLYPKGWREPSLFSSTQVHEGSSNSMLVHQFVVIIFTSRFNVNSKLQDPPTLGYLQNKAPTSWHLAVQSRGLPKDGFPSQNPAKIHPIPPS